SRGAMGEEHPLTLRVARNLAVCRRRDGALDEAAKLSGETLRRFVARYGAGHADSLATAINLSVDLRLAGDHEQSRALGEDTAGRYAALLGENHAYTLLTRINLAATLRAIPRLDAAHEVRSGGASWPGTGRGTPTPSRRPSTSPPTCGWPATTSSPARWARTPPAGTRRCSARTTPTPC